MTFRSFVSVLVAGLVAIPGARFNYAAEGTVGLLMIDSIHLEGKEVVVTVQVPPEVKRVILESRTRIGSGSWEPIAIRRLDGSTTEIRTVVFRVPLTGQMELLRVRGDSGDVLPATFYQGAKEFGNPTAGAPGARTGTDVVAAPPESGAATPGGDKADTRAVVESDIWKIEGDTLYFFNQYRGLQVIDITNPEAPVIRGTYNMPAAGEQMYLLSPTRVVLLVHDFCGGWGASAESQIVLLELHDGKPSLVGQMPVPGALRESRMVGTALYVASERYRPITITNSKGGTEEIWEWGSQISSFDLSAFAPSKPKFVEWAPGSGNAIQATDRFLFVATPRNEVERWYGASDVRIFDISSPDGTMQPLSKISVAGRVKDKFKMHLNGDVFAVVTESWDNTWKTQVETFSLADPRNPVQLGAMPIIDRERLFATRFSGSVLYAVTFFIVDPLWIIDLSDPVKPRKVGELEIPGWSTFIQPLGDRLVTVGIDNTEGWRTSVQLFDVANPEKPTLVSKILLGEGNHSSSEANQDEKAFGVLPEQNLILVPFSSWSEKGAVEAVQLIDLEPSGLKKRGLIDHSFPARRAALHRDRILSISGSELLGVDATNRDQPKVVSRTELSWAADRLFLVGDQLVSIAQHGKRPLLHVTAASDPSKVINRIELAELPLLGATVSDQRLFVLQGRSTELIWPKIWNPTNYVPLGTNQARLKLSIYDLKQLPQAPQLGQFEREYGEGQKYWSEFSALFPKPGLLVWSQNRSGYGWRGGPIILEGDVAVGAPPPNRTASSLMPIWWGGNSDALLLAFDVTGSAPNFLSEVNVRGTNNWWNFSQAYTQNGLVFMSHETSEYDPTFQMPAQTYREWDGTKFVEVVRTPPPGAWVQQYFLDVVSYADPSAPAARKPVGIPGALIGLARNGNLLYTQGYRYADPKTLTDWAERIDVSAYDGVEAHLVDSMKLPQVWPRPTLVAKDHLLIGRASDKEIPAAIEVWAVSDAAKLTRVGETGVTMAVQNFSVVDNLLLAQVNNEVSIYDMANFPSLRLAGSGGPGGCLGFNLQYVDGFSSRGVWLPLGMYGVMRIELKP